MNVSIIKMCLDTSTLAKSIMGGGSNNIVAAIPPRLAENPIGEPISDCVATSHLRISQPRSLRPPPDHRGAAPLRCPAPYHYRAAPLSQPPADHRRVAPLRRPPADHRGVTPLRRPPEDHRGAAPLRWPRPRPRSSPPPAYTRPPPLPPLRSLSSHLSRRRAPAGCSSPSSIPTRSPTPPSALWPSPAAG
jgi:hypothetical protein